MQPKRQNRRIVMPELLDDLKCTDPRAARSRRDLQRVHRALGTLSILRRAIDEMRLAVPPTHVLELGAGDGTMLLRLAQALQPRWTGVNLTLLDRQDLLSNQTREGYQQVGWNLTVLREDALSWVRDREPQRYDLILTTLFLHHFAAGDLDALMAAIALRSNAFIACEPRRDMASRLGSRLIGLLGANAVTRADAVTSVAAGFVGRELSALWPASAVDWRIDEAVAPPFTHRFAAVRASVQQGGCA
jgi:SAM-dependent methyltransferase